MAEQAVILYKKGEIVLCRHYNSGRADPFSEGHTLPLVDETKEGWYKGVVRTDYYSNSTNSVSIHFAGDSFFSAFSNSREIDWEVHPSQVKKLSRTIKQQVQELVTNVPVV